MRMVPRGGRPPGGARRFGFRSQHESAGCGNPETLSGAGRASRPPVGRLAARAHAPGVVKGPGLGRTIESAIVASLPEKRTLGTLPRPRGAVTQLSADHEQGNRVRPWPRAIVKLRRARPAMTTLGGGRDAVWQGSALGPGPHDHLSACAASRASVTIRGMPDQICRRCSLLNIAFGDARPAAV